MADDARVSSGRDKERGIIGYGTEMHPRTSAWRLTVLRPSSKVISGGEPGSQGCLRAGRLRRHGLRPDSPQSTLVPPRLWRPGSIVIRLSEIFSETQSRSGVLVGKAPQSESLAIALMHREGQSQRNSWEEPLCKVVR